MLIPPSTRTPVARLRRRSRRVVLESLEPRTLLTAIDPWSLGRGHAEFDRDHDGGRGRGGGRTETHWLNGTPQQFIMDTAEIVEVASTGLTAGGANSALYSLGSIPALSSDPGAPATLYLDFDGHFEPTWGTYSNLSSPAYDIDGDQSTFSDGELANIEAIWRGVVEDYAPFKINVTTVQPAVLAPGVPIDQANKVALRVAVGGSFEVLGKGIGSGGFAYINAFTNSIANVAYALPGSGSGTSSPAVTADIISHEAGHSFGLQHQGFVGDRSLWEPLMSPVVTGAPATTWHNGLNTLTPATLQDDMAIIAGTTNGFGYRADDHANAASSATALTASGSTWAGAGRLGQNTDVDFFKFTVGVTDTYRAIVQGLEVTSNLDAALELRNAAGTLLASASPSDSTAASIVRYLTAGSYTLAVKGSGVYGWIGQYTLNVDTPPAGITVRPSSNVLSTAEDGRSATFTVALDTRPVSDVTIPVSSTNPAEGAVSTSSLVFTPANWDIPQTVTVTGMADGTSDNDVPYLVILGAAVGADPDYNDRDAADLSLVNIDTDAAGSIYRVDTLNDTIVRSNLSGSQPEVLVDLKAIFGDTVNYSPKALAFDPVDGHIYWIDSTTRDIYRANLDGSDGRVVVALDAGPTYGIALDPVGRKLYWPMNTVGIQRANLDGTGIETIFSLPSTSFRSLALDLAGGKLYFTDMTNAAIRRVNLDGTAPEVLWTNPVPSLTGSLALDVAAGKMYWTAPSQGLILRANLDGSNVEPLVDLAAIFGEPIPYALSFGIALDVAAGKMYWTDFATKAIYRADLDGSKVALLSAVGNPDGLILVPPTPGISVRPRSGLTTTEAGGTATFTVALATRPTAAVTIPVSTGDATEGTASVSSLTFTPDNWNVPQVVTVTGVNDAIYDLDVAFTIILGLAASADPAYSGLDPVDVSATNTDDDPAPTKFYVVNDGSPDRTYEYGPTGSAAENYAVNVGNTAPRGAASTAAGDKVWVVDANKKVYVYSPSGALLGSWTAGSLASNATVEGIATNGTDVWIVDARQDKVFRYTNAGGRTSGSQNAAGSFSLNSGNTSPKDIVTDGTSLWVINDSTTDKVFKYTLSGSLLGSWTIAGAGTSPTGITLDPTGGGQLWIVDSGTDRVYQFDDARGRTSGSQSPSTSFALAAGNTNPQGIADPPSDESIRVEADPLRSPARNRLRASAARARLRALVADDRRLNRLATGLLGGLG